MKIKSLVVVLFLSILCVHSQRRRNMNNNNSLNAIRNGVSPQKMMTLYGLFVRVVCPARRFARCLGQRR